MHRFTAAPKRYAGLQPRSAAMSDYYSNSRVPEVEEAQGQPCGAAIAGVCRGKETPERDIHERVRRSAAGGLVQAAALGTVIVCRACHEYISTHPIQARALGLSMTRREASGED